MLNVFVNLLNSPFVENTNPTVTQILVNYPHRFHMIFEQAFPTIDLDKNNQ